STWSCRCGRCAGPGREDLRSSIAVSGHRDLPRAKALDPAITDLPSGQVTTDQGVHVQPGMTLLQPAHDPPESEPIQVGERRLGNPVLKVGAPTPQRRVQPAQQASESAMRCPAGQTADLV